MTVHQVIRDNSAMTSESSVSSKFQSAVMLLTSHSALSPNNPNHLSDRYLEVLSLHIIAGKPRQIMSVVHAVAVAWTCWRHFAITSKDLYCN